MNAATRAHIGARLQEARNALGLTVDSMALKTGVPKSTLRKWLEGRVPPSSDGLSRIEALGVSLVWLLKGEGPALASRSSAGPGFWSGENPDYLEVPLFDVRVAAGHGALNEHERQLGSLAFRRDWVRKEIGAPLEQLALVYVQGDSMEPELRDGDVVMVDRSVQDAAREGIYVLMLDDNLVIKRLQRLPDRKVRISSANPAYAPFVMDDTWDDADHWIVGRAVWSGRRL